jgi:uncharacterized membrane protein
MTSLKKIAVLAFITVALIVPALAISKDVSGEAKLWDGGIWVSNSFSDRSDGTITVRMVDVVDGDVITVKITDLAENMFPGATRTVTVTEADEERGYINIDVTFRMGTPGHYRAQVIVTGDNVIAPPYNQKSFEFDVGKSIWSSVWTYVAIIVVIVIIGIVLLIRMRGAPKVDHAGAFTALEEERVEKKRTTSAKKEQYKSRRK